VLGDADTGNRRAVAAGSAGAAASVAIPDESGIVNLDDAARQWVVHRQGKVNRPGGPRRERVGNYGEGADGARRAARYATSPTGGAGSGVKGGVGRHRVGNDNGVQGRPAGIGVGQGINYHPARRSDRPAVVFSDQDARNWSYDSIAIAG